MYDSDFAEKSYMSAAKQFLKDFQERPLTISYASGLKPEKLILGKGKDPLEVPVLTSTATPNISTLKNAQKKRKKHRAAPVLLTVIHGGQASLCGLSRDNPPVYKDIQIDRAEKFCRMALKQPNRHKAHRFCSHFLPSIETGLFGLNNRGMLSSHHLIHGVKQRPDWEKAKKLSRSIIHFEREELLKKLGFHITRLDRLTYILKSRDKKRALAVLLEPVENHESEALRFNEMSPVRYALEKADQENMPYVLMVQNNHIRLYKAGKESGISSNSQTENYIECQPSLLQEENLGFLHLIFSAEALSKGGSLEEISENSKRFSANVAKNLKTRIYDKIVPQIAQGIFHAKKLQNPSSKDLMQIYEMALTVLFRLLFIAHAEDKDLLPYNTNSAYKKRSLKQKAQELSELFKRGGKPEQGDSHWQETASLWQAIDKGHSEWGIMAYNGGLFSSEKSISETGFEISKISIKNKFFASALKSLLLMKTEEQDLAPVDFRFMGPKEFGTVYEGLLESSLSIAKEDLALDTKNIYVPIKKSKTSSRKLAKRVDVKKGELYLHNQSGARKASGSYYTKSFAVEHILDKSLEPALQKHFERLNKLHDKEAEKEFFNFRTADIAMGSGHFLVAAVDRIEQGMADYLHNRPLESVQNNLDKIKIQADENLQNISDDYFPVENRKLLARHIAKHCIYGVDNNELAVQLARLSLWSHTFVPGLPLSYFNHNLICGNSLVGLGTIKEFQSELKSKIDKGNLTLDLINREELLGQAKKPLREMKNLSDSNLEEIRQSRKTQKEIESSLKDTKALFDVALFNRIKNKGDINKIEGLMLSWKKNPKSIHKSKELKSAREELKGLQTLHFPIAFPEVFLRERPGFDCIIGNPPWEQINIERHAFWARYFPGLRGLSQKEREREYVKLEKRHPYLLKQYELEISKKYKLNSILKSIMYKNSSSGKSDLYKFFSWRFWYLICEEGGFLGVVLKGSVCQSEGSKNFRREIFKKSKTHITTLVNNSGWIFKDVDGIRIIILSLEKNQKLPHSLERKEQTYPDFRSNSQLDSRRAKTRQVKQIKDFVLEMRDKRETLYGKHGHKKHKTEKRTIYIQGPFRSLEEFKAGKNKSILSFSEKQVLSWTDSASLPSLPKEASLGVFLQMRKSPRLDLNDRKSWRAQPLQEMNTTIQKNLMDLKSLKCPKGYWPVWTGRSFDIWNPDTGKYYAYADPKKAIPWLLKKRPNRHKNLKSSHSEFSSEYVKNKQTLPCFKPRIVFRDVCSADRPRTVHVSLLPPEALLVHKAPYLLFSRGDEKDEAFLLGILSSIPLDWYARRFISTNSLGFFLLNTFPIPRHDRKNPLWKRAVSLSGRLAAPDKRFAKWAKAVGVRCGPLDKERKTDMIYELDAITAHLYGLSQKQLLHIFKTFHKTWEYQTRLQAVLKHYNFWKKKY